MDERLRELKERHEARIKSMELLRIADEETDRRFAHVVELFARTREVFAKFHGFRGDAGGGPVNPSDCAGI
jgi:hypothetical protein